MAHVGSEQECVDSERPRTHDSTGGGGFRVPRRYVGTAKEGPDLGKAMFIATVEKGSAANLFLYVLCFISTRAALFTCKILCDIRFSYGKKPITMLIIIC